MIAVDPLGFASVFLNSFCTIFANALCLYLALQVFFPRRRAPYLFWGLFLVKISLVAAVDAMGAFGVAPQLAAVFRLVIPLLGVGMYLTLYHTWEGGLANIWFVAMAVDLLAGLTFAVAAGLTSYLFRGTLSMAYIGPFGLASVFRPLVEFGLLWMLVQLLKPLGLRIAGYTFRHERAEVAGALLLVAFVGFTTSLDIGNSGMFGNLWLGFAVPPVGLAVMGPYLVWRWRRARVRQERLVRQKALISACEQMMGSQSAFLEQSRWMLDGLSQRIDGVNAGEDVGLRRRVDALRQACDRLRFGTYSDNPVLDVVLMGYEKRFQKAGYRVAYRVAPLCAPGDRVALAARDLLEWAFQMKEPADNVRCRRTRFAHDGASGDAGRERRIAHYGGEPHGFVRAPVVSHAQGPARIAWRGDARGGGYCPHVRRGAFVVVRPRGAHVVGNRAPGGRAGGRPSRVAVP